MYSWDMNRYLWKDVKAFDTFGIAVVGMHKASLDNPKDFQMIADIFDGIMQTYEERYGPIEDPIFFWYLATCNAFFLQVGNKFDDLGVSRVAYIVNGYKEGLTKHLLYPSYTKLMMDVIFENMEQFANEHDKVWISSNKHKFVPIPI